MKKSKKLNLPLLSSAPLKSMAKFESWLAIFIIFFLLLTNLAEARETARVLPKGIRRARVVGVATGTVSSTYNENGNLQGLTYSLNRTVTIADLAQNADAQTKQKLTALVNSLNSIQPGLGNDLAASQLYSDLEIDTKITLAAFEYGMTDRLSLGIRMPLVKRSAHTKFNVNTINNAAAINQQLGGLSPDLTTGLYTIENKQLNTAFFQNALFTAKGYDAPASFEKTQVGDLEFGGKYNFYRSDDFYSSFVLGFSVPTGAKSDLKNPFDKGNSKETFCSAVQLLQEVYPVKNLTIGGAAKIGASLKDTRNRAVPRNESDTLPSLLPADGQVFEVTRQRGTQIDTELSAHYKLFQGSVGVWGAYQYSQKEKDTFTGPKKNFYYDGLSKNTNYRLHASEVGIEYSTVPAFLKKKFAVPMEVSLLYNQPIKGVNTPSAPYARLDLMVYF